MKNFHFLATLFVSGLVLSTTSCGDDTEETITPPPSGAKISLSVTGGEAVTVDGADVTKSIKITATEKSDKDIVVALKSDAAAGQVAFPVNPVTIKAGATSVEAGVTFTLEGFPAGTTEKNIGVTISSTTPNVTIGTATSTFSVKGKGGVELVDLVVTTNGTEFNTTDAAQEALLTFTLAKPLDTDVTVALAYANDSELKDVVLPEVKIAKGETTVTSKITVAQGVAGVMKLTLATESAKLDKSALTLTFKNDAKLAASISAKEGTTVTVPNDADVTKTFTISLNKKPSKDVTINLALTGNENNGAQLSTSTVNFTTNDQTKDVTVTFKKDVFNSASVTANVAVTATSPDVTVAGSPLTYTVKGTTTVDPGVKQQLGLKFTVEGTGEEPRDNTRMDLPYNNNGDGNPATRYDFWIQINRADGAAQVGDVKIHLDIEGFDSGDYYCADIDANGDYILKPDKSGWAFTISFEKAKGKVKNGKITFTSTEATIDSGMITVTTK